MIITKKKIVSFISYTITAYFLMCNIVYGFGDIEGQLLDADPDKLLKWTRRDTSSIGDIRTVGYLNDRFVAASATYIMTSLDGNEWNEIESPGTSHESTVFGNGLYLIGGAHGAMNVSEDGVSWSRITYPLSFIKELLYVENRFIGVGNVSVYKSDGGLIWEMINPGFSINLERNLEGILHNNGLYIIVGENGTIRTSEDTDNWIARDDLRGIGRLFSVAYGNGKYIAVGESILISENAEKWEWLVLGLDNREQLRKIIFVDGVFYAVGGIRDEKGTIIKSEDGLTWTSIDINAKGMLFDIAHHGQRFVTVGQSGRLFTAGLFEVIINVPEGGKVSVPLEQTISAGTTISVSATPPDDKFFLGWTGSINTDSNPLTITIESDINLTAQFGQILPPSISSQPQSQLIDIGQDIQIFPQILNLNFYPHEFQWFLGKSGDVSNPIEGETGLSLSLSSIEENSYYWVRVTNEKGVLDSETAVITLRQTYFTTPNTVLVHGLGDIAGENIQHPTGNIYDQVLLTGSSVTIVAKQGQITRTSYIDENDDIVQVEFSGAGTLTLAIGSESYRPPALPAKYNQSVSYVKGKATIAIVGADESTNVSVFSVGVINASNPGLFPENENYDGRADISFIKISGSAIGGIFCANAHFSNDVGYVGINALKVPVKNRLIIGDLDAFDDAYPILLIGSDSELISDNGKLLLAGGDLKQTNGKAIHVAAFDPVAPFSIKTQDNVRSNGALETKRQVEAQFRNNSGFIFEVPVQ